MASRSNAKEIQLSTATAISPARHGGSPPRQTAAPGVDDAESQDAPQSDGGSGERGSTDNGGINRRNELAADRTVFAAERTYGAWVRTGLAALASGVGANKLLAGVITEWGIWGVSTVLVLFSAFCFGAAVWREIFPRPLSPRPDTHRIPSALLVAMNGFLALVALVALVSIWFGRAGSE